MEYIYAVMLLNKAGQKVDEKSVTAVLKAAGVDADSGKVKSLIAALDGVDIEKVISESGSVVAAAPAAGGASSGGSEAPAAEAAAPKEEKKEAAPAADASAGLGSLF